MFTDKHSLGKVRGKVVNPNSAFRIPDSDATAISSQFTAFEPDQFLGAAPPWR
jgi:hypothetical protein